MKRIALPKNILIPAGTVLQAAPRSMNFDTPHYMLTIGVGADNYATLIMHEDTIPALKNIIPDVTIY